MSLNISSEHSTVFQPLSTSKASPRWTFESVSRILASRKDVEAVLQLRGDDALQLVDALDQILDSDDLDKKLSKRFLTTLRKLCGLCRILPASHMLSSGLEFIGDGPRKSGGFADVWQGNYNDRVVAIKALRVCATDDLDKLKKLFCKEALDWKRLSHLNVLPFLGASTARFSFCLVSHWMAHGNIMEFVKERPEFNRPVLLVDVTSGLSYLHSMNLVHGDLKGANILINDHLRACLADFGLMKVLSDPSTMHIYASTTSTSAAGGTVRWMAPELLNPEQFKLNHVIPTKASDIYALGMVILEVLTGAIPFHEYNIHIVTHKVISGVRPMRPTDATIGGLSDDVWRIMESCWNDHSNERPELPAVFKVLSRAVEFWNPPPPTAATSEAGSSKSDDSDIWSDDPASRPPSALSDRSESPEHTRRATTLDSALHQQAVQLPVDQDSRPAPRPPFTLPPSSVRGVAPETPGSRPAPPTASHPPQNQNAHIYVPAGARDPLDAEVAHIVNSIPHGLRVKRLGPPLKTAPKEGEEVRARYAVSNASASKIITCRLTTLVRPGARGSGEDPTTTKKIMCRVGGEWQDLQIYILNRQAGIH